MNTASPLLIASLVCLLVACGESEPERDYSRPPEYQNSAAEYLLSQQAKNEQQKREERESEAKRIRERRAEVELGEIPPGFPAAFVGLPGAEFDRALASDELRVVEQRLPGAPADVLESMKAAAEADGWVLEISTQGEEPLQASFQKGSQQVFVHFVSNPDAGTQVTTMLMELQPGPAAPGP